MERRQTGETDTWEAALGHLAEVAILYRGAALSAVTNHVYSVAEVVRAHVHEHGAGDIDAQVKDHVESLRKELNAVLDQLIAARPGS